ncbi:uncharacterized protein LOC135489710 [Lineus longissimus]|uniref:uncharacterized protein LOC135489710 n=1 Tax=Lineus longissimus TaxID=88925 RepID=UPI002B4FAE34
MIGDKARDFIQRKAEVSLREKRIEEAFTGIKNFFKEAVKYIIQKLPLNDDLFHHAEVADVSIRTNALEGEDLRYFLKRFPVLLPQGVDEETVEMEFAEYQAEDNIPTGVEGMDKVWVRIGAMKDGAGVLKYRNLSHVMLGILCIPHSNAQSERVFSMIRHNKTWKRGSLGDDTVEALMLAKSRDGQAHTRVYSSDNLKHVKSAYYQSLKK